MKRLVSLAITTALLLTIVLSTGMTAGAANLWGPFDGYTGIKGSVAENGNTVSLNGYGAAKHLNKIAVKEGTEISFQINPRVLSATRQYFALAFLNVENSYFGNPTRDTGDGFAVQLRGFDPYTNGCGVYYSAVTDGVYEKNATLGTTDGLISNASSNMTTTTYYFTITRKTQTINTVNYTWEILLEVPGATPAVTKTIQLTDAEVPADCFANGLFVTVGARTSTYEEYDISNFTIEQPYEGSPFNGFTPVRGLSSTAGSIVSTDKSAVITGYGGASYDNGIGNGGITNGIAVEFSLDNYPAGSNWFSLGVVDVPDVFWGNPADGSQGLITLVKVSGSNVTVEVRNLKTAQTDVLGTLTAAGATNKHTLSINKKDDVWYIALDGGVNYISIDADKVPLGAESYLVAGANGSAEMQMTVTGIYIDSQMTEGMFPTYYTGNDMSDFSIVRGLAGSVFKEKEALLLGGGGASFAKPVTGGVSVKFTLADTAGAGWFNFGLLDKPGVFWGNINDGGPNGIIVLITTTAVNINVSVRQMTSASTAPVILGSLTAAGPQSPHTLTFHMQNGNWYVTLDGGTNYFSVAASTIGLGDTQYFVAGANGAANIKMAVSGVYMAEKLGADAFPAIANTTEGDISGDGVLNGNDLTMAKKNMLKLMGFNGLQDSTADIDGDGFITVLDLVELKKLMTEV